MVVANGFQKRTLTECVEGVRGEAVFYMRDNREVLREQVQLVSGPNKMMFRPEYWGGADGSWEGHAMRGIYLQRVYYAVRQEVMQNVSGNVFWSEQSEGSENCLWGWFRYFLTRL